jgi:hypothetical protein
MGITLIVRVLSLMSLKIFLNILRKILLDGKLSPFSIA